MPTLPLPADPALQAQIAAAPDPVGVPPAALDAAASALADADSLLITMGAGMGVDSGLPDFRGPEGFWRAYPALAALGLRFEEAANPRWFYEDPTLAWAFYGHRMHLYRDTVPHVGFGILRAWAASRPSFVFTSNVDGQAQRAGFAADQVYEVHGSIHWLQRLDGEGGVLSADGVVVDIDPARFRAREPLPTCPRTGARARPNILMFGDADWEQSRAAAAHDRYQRFLGARGRRPAVIELGAGTAIPTVRWESARASAGGSLIRVNVREAQGPPGCISLPGGAAATLLALARRLA